jgi:multiple sugar transport system substrate-binding protein
MRHRVSRALLAILLLVFPVMGTAITHAARPHAENITLTWEDYFTGCPKDPYCAALDTLRKEYEASHPGITLKRTTVGFGDLLPKVLQQAATHTLPDVLILDNPQVQDVASSGVLASLAPYTKGWSNLSQYYSSSLSTATWQGKLYGIPIGNNDLALIYNIKMFKAAHISHPPTTWAELRADAKKLTHGHVYGMVFSAAPTEEGTWQWEPFFWGNGGDLRQVSAPPGVEALTLWAQLMSDGSVSKSALNWGQGDVESQFNAGNAAMMEMGGWVLGDEKAVKGLQFGITYLPRKSASMPPVSPLGGEVWTLPASTPARQQAAWTFLKWTQDPARILTLDTQEGYLPAYKPANKLFVERNPLQRIFALELPTSRARAQLFGPKYPQVSEAIWKAIQLALTGSQSPQQALQTAQATIDQL